jgi:hypothetical protein
MSSGTPNQAQHHQHKGAGPPTRSASIASSGCATLQAGLPLLRMPPFSRAILGRVSPSSSMWSKPSDVTPHTAGWGMTANQFMDRYYIT